MPIRATGYLRIHLPEGPGPGPAPVVVALHGYGQPPEAMLAYARTVAPPEAVIVAPEGPAAFYRNPRARGGAARGGVGYGWIADPRRADAEARNGLLLSAALEAAQARFRIDPSRIALLAYSQGVGVATHYFVNHAGRIAGLAALAGGVPGSWRERLGELAGRPVLWVSGRRDHAYPPSYSGPLVATLRAAGIDLEACEFDEGHDLLVAARPRVRRWLENTLSASRSKA